TGDPRFDPAVPLAVGAVLVLGVAVAILSRRLLDGSRNAWILLVGLDVAALAAGTWASGREPLVGVPLASGGLAGLAGLLLPGVARHCAR
ncbi:MAG TPA: hypothetical protein VHH36_08510, partial [Candidatus Thermoplasmatota archaeon]|nr:hypothetical protein [Candidatus Thermoplasmatota archaeon]